MITRKTAVFLGALMFLMVGFDQLPHQLLDEDDMVSDSAADVASQQSLKAFVTSGTINMSGKTLTSPVLNTGISGTAFLDEDNMVSDSATKLASQQSIKKYVDDNAGGGQWTKIETKTASSSTTIDFTTLSGAYKDFKVIGSAVVPVTDGAEFLCRISVASSWKSGASDYRWINSLNENGVWTATADVTANSIQIQANIGSGATESASFELLLPHPAGTVLWKTIMADSWGVGITSANIIRTQSTGFYDIASSAIDGMRFLFSTGNIESGTFTLYGRMN